MVTRRKTVRAIGRSFLCFANAHTLVQLVYMQEPRILFQDDYILLIDKPSGLMVHADLRSDVPTLVDWLIEKFPELRGVGEEGKWGIAHRLDRETSGIMIVARTSKALQSLKKQFQGREVRKTYRAFVYGPLKDERGIIDRPIGSARGGVAPRSAVRPYGKMREAVTMYRRIANGIGAAYVEVFPKTGRTHQIRAHFAAIQHPIVADSQYAPGRPPILHFSRLALHALAISFAHPATGEQVTFEAPLPEEFLRAEKELQ